MIAKLPFTQIHTGGEDMVDRVETRPVAPYEMQHKINELVDAVNEIMTWRFDCDDEMVAENVPDLDIQLSWIGHLCRFWDSNKIESTYAILDDINVWCEHPYRESSGNQYEHCEPVKPDDDIIYKGE